jgi:hypothetical protein
MGNFRGLLVWQKAKELAVKIYKLVKTQPVSKDLDSGIRYKELL